MTRAAGGTRRAVGVLAATAFSLLLAGSNAMTPLMPIYRNVLDFTPTTMALSFVCYVGFQVLVLIALSRLPFARAAPALLCMALATAVASDMLMSSATERGILFGRVLIGIACGLGAGSASVFVVASLGARGRSVTTTGNLVGAVVGTAASQVLVALLGPAAMSSTFQVHAAACVALLGCLATLLARDRRLRLDEAPAAESQAVALSGFASAWPFVVGCAGWIVLSCLITFAPSVFADAGLTGARDLGVIVILVASAGGQLLSPLMARRMPWISGLGAFTAGLVLMLVASKVRHQPLAIVSCGTLGFGVGVSYRAALVALTRGATARRQGAIAATYGAVTYTASTAGVLAAGLWADRVGLEAMFINGLAAFAVVTAIALGWAPRLRDTLE